MLHSWARKTGLAQSECDDLTQEVLAIVSRKISTFQYDPNKGTFRSWLKTIARRKALELKSKNREAIADTALLSMKEDEANDLEKSFEQEYNRHIVHGMLARVKGSFSELQWNVFLDLAMKQIAAKTVAAKYGISEGNAFVIKGRVLRRLKQESQEFLE